MAEYNAKRRWEDRPGLEEYHRQREEKAIRVRAKQMEMPLHLRTGTNPLDMGCPANYLPQSLRAAQLPVKMATDPKWSTDLKKLNDRIGMRIEYERTVSASVPGMMSPEMHYMRPKRYLSNPPTPYFVPGKKSE